MSSKTSENVEITLQGDYDEDTTHKVEQTSTGVKVEVKSKRGNGTDDRDEVKVYGYYEDEDEAKAKSGKLTEIAQLRMIEARAMGESGFNKNDE